MDDQHKNVNGEVDTVSTEPTPATPETNMATPSTVETSQVATISDVTTVEESTAETAEVSKKNHSGLIAIVIILAMIAIAAGAFWYQKTHSDSASVALGGKTYPAVVAVVNGEDVDGEKFQQSYLQAESIATQQGFDVSDPEVQAQVAEQALSVLINTVLIVQAAKEAGHTASDEEIDAEIAKLETQFGGSEQLASVLASAGLSESAVRDDLGEQIIVDKYLNESEEWKTISVTDEEKHAFYDQVAGFSSTTPPYEEVESMVEEQLLSQKQQDATQAIIDSLRADAEIDERI